MKSKFVTVLCILVFGICVVFTGCGNKKEKDAGTTGKATKENKTTENASSGTTSPAEEVTEAIVTEKVDIIDINSKTRPFAISVNNTPVAVKVQTGLNKAFVVYEIPTEGYTSRLLAFFKDVPEDLVVGTTRSARHNFLDYCYEWDAIFVHFGWSHYVEAEERAGAIDFINALVDPAPFWRNNPENLDSEHTAYTSISKIKDYLSVKGYAAQSENAVVPFKYSVSDVDLSSKNDAIELHSIKLPYSGYQYTVFTYDAGKGVYLRSESGDANIDHETGEQFDTKNIIVQKINHTICDDGKYWDLETVGSGTGYYITGGYAVPITWSKESRKARTVYRYADGTEIELSDGRTYVELHGTDMELTLNY